MRLYLARAITPLAVCTFTFTFTFAAAGEETTLPPPPPPGSGTASPPPPEQSGSAEGGEAARPGDSLPHMQDGFYLSFGAGFGFLKDDFEQTFGFFVSRKVTGSAEGGSGAFHLAIGGTPGRGFVVGGGIFAEQVVDPKIQIDGVDATATSDVGVGTFVLVGPFVDWYFTPGEGWHLMGALGGATIRITDASGNKDDSRSPGGGGGMIGIGYNLWVGEQWSIGVLGRGMGGALYADNLTHQVTVGSLVITGTYH